MNLAKHKLAIGAAVIAAGALGYYLYRRGGGRPVCGPGATWKVVTDPTGYSPAVAEQIRRYGGYCAKAGSVSDAFDGGSYESGLDDLGAEDSYLITHPWQLLD